MAPKVNRPDPVSETELAVLKALWKLGPGTVRDVDEVLRRGGRRWAYTTVLTLLKRLEAKGYVDSDASSTAHVFRAAVTRQKLLSLRLRVLADELTEGTATPLVQALVEDKRLTDADIEELRQLLDRVEKAR